MTPNASAAPASARKRLLVAQLGVASVLFGVWSGCGLETGGLDPGNTPHDAAADATTSDVRVDRAEADSAILETSLSDVDADADAGTQPCRFESADDGGLGTPTVAFQTFGENMVGCTGSVTWTDRAKLCNEAAGCTPCSASEWLERMGDAAPRHQYWTATELRYTGVQATCRATPDPSQSLCPGMPFRVCIDGDGSVDAAGFSLASIDTSGNRCNFTQCGYSDGGDAGDAGDAKPPNFHFGGCSNNPTAGTLCCCESD